MRDAYRKIGRLYGVGIGPGDPKLLTLKAKEILDSVQTIFVPRSGDGKASSARSIVEAITARPKNFIELTFPMVKEKKQLNAYWLKAAHKIAKVLKNGKPAAFVTIGDPLIYSTYIYLLETLREYFPNIKLETIPGVSAFNAAAASTGIPLVKGNEKLAILPVTPNLKGLRRALREFDTVVLMKVGSKLAQVVRLLKKIKLAKNSILISHAGQPNERIVKDILALKEKKIGYLSVIIVKSKGL